MYGGCVLSCSVDMRARVRISPSDRLVLATDGQQFQISNRNDLKPRGDHFDVVRAILDYLKFPAIECRVEYESEIPVRSGLGGSTSLMVALLRGLLAWQNVHLNAYRLAEMARYIELNHLKVMCGYQDAYMASFGGLNFVDCRGKQFYRESEAELFATIESLAPFVPKLPFILGFTGVQHSSGSVHKPLRERWLEGERAVVAAYERIIDIALMGKKALMLEDWRTLASLMNENHAIQRDLGGSGESNERLIAAALAAGAPAAKLAGAGDGGTIIALWLKEDSSCLESALRQAGATATFRLKIAPGVLIENER